MTTIIYTAPILPRKPKLSRHVLRPIPTRVNSTGKLPVENVCEIRSPHNEPPTTPTNYRGIDNEDGHELNLNLNERDPLPPCRYWSSYHRVHHSSHSGHFHSSESVCLILDNNQLGVQFLLGFN